MKKIFFAFLAFISFANAVSLMNYEIFDNSDSIDITLSFDSAYKPDIFRKIDKDELSIILKGAMSEEKFNNQINSKVISEFSIIPAENSMQIVFKKAANLNVDALIGKDALSLTLRVSNSSYKQVKLDPDNLKTSGGSGGFAKIFSIILSVLVGLFFVILLLKFLFKRKNKKTVDSTWSAFDRVFEKDEVSLNPENSHIQNGETAEIPAENEFKFSHKIEDENLEEISKENLGENLDENSPDLDILKEENSEFIAENEPDKQMEDETSNQEAREEEIATYGYAPKHSISDVLDDEMRDSVDDEIASVILQRKIDANSTALIVKYGKNSHLVVLKKSNIVKDDDE